jgi:hypothetical protein
VHQIEGQAWQFFAFTNKKLACYFDAKTYRFFWLHLVRKFQEKRLKNHPHLREFLSPVLYHLGLSP